MPRIFTLHDARQEKRLLDERRFGPSRDRAEAAQAEKRRVEQLLLAHPQIGVLNSGTFYVWPPGGVYAESRSIDTLVTKLQGSKEPS